MSILKKYKIVSITSLSILILIAINCSGGYIGEKCVIDLNKDWKFREKGKEDWHSAKVPGCVHTDLMDNRLIGDPFYRDNETKLQWIGKTDWEYKKEFSIDGKTLSYKNIELVFKGLDTYAKVFLNGKLIIDANNMFREWRINCEELLKEGPNELLINFQPPESKISSIKKKFIYELPSANDTSHTSSYIRKAPYHFGWDWGPRFITCGIWQDVQLELWNAVKISDFQIVQNQIESNLATLSAEVEIQSSGEKDVILLLESEEKCFNSVKKNARVHVGVNEETIDFNISEPKLWWPNGYGEQNLYNIKLTLTIDGKVVDQKLTKIGLRTLKLRREPDKWGKSFEFIINGVSIFAKGGNWIPADNFLNRITKDKYRYLINSCKDANMNMLRVWGGGIYENDYFYELCDEMGIMVWQDFMFACSMYPGDEKFLENVKQEATYNIKRIRNHPSIVLWCGNNEIEAAWFDWGWKDYLPKELWKDNEKLFYKILPDLCSSLDPSRPYWPGSPSSNLEDRPNSQKVGDMHYWGVWHAAQPFEKFKEQFPRFMSEYGFQSFPELKTINSFTIPEDHDINSAVITIHQKHNRGNKLILEYMLRRYPEPKDFSSFLYVSQIVQAEGIKIGTEHLRRIRPQCMGTLYWQINDCWPVASWSSIDYFGYWKALHYYARRFYNDILISPSIENGIINFYVVSDRVNNTEAKLSIYLFEFNGNSLKSIINDIKIAPLKSDIYFSMKENEILNGFDLSKIFLYCELEENGKIISSNTYLFDLPKNLNFPKPEITTTIATNQNGVMIELESKNFAKCVYLSTDKYDGFFTDNYFDLIPNKKVAIEFKSNSKINLEVFKKDLKIISIVDAF